MSNKRSMFAKGYNVQAITKQYTHQTVHTYAHKH